MLNRAGSGISTVVRRVARLGRGGKDGSDGGRSGSGEARDTMLNAADLAVVSRSRSDTTTPDQYVTEEIAAAARRAAEAEAAAAVAAATAAAAEAEAQKARQAQNDAALKGISGLVGRLRGSRLVGRLRGSTALSSRALTSAPVSGSPSFSQAEGGRGLRERLRDRWERRRSSRSQARSTAPDYDLGISAVRPNGPKTGSRIAKASMNSMNPIAALGSTLNGLQSAEADPVSGVERPQREPLIGEGKVEEGEGGGNGEGGAEEERFVLPGGLSLNGLTLDGFDWGKGIVSGASSQDTGANSEIDGGIDGASRDTSAEVGRGSTSHSSNSQFAR